MKPVSYLPQERRHIVVALNPKAGAKSGRRRVERLTELLQASNFVCEILTDRDEAARRCERLHNDGELRVIVAAGGDGTLHSVVNNSPPDVPVTTFPLGTENLFSKYLGITAKPQVLAGVIEAGLMVSPDAGKVGDKTFLLMASCGFDADVVRRLHDDRKGHIRHWSYAKPILNSIRKYNFPELRITCGEDTEVIDARWAFIFNFPCYAFGLGIVPDADGTDGLLDLCTFRKGSFLSGLRYLSQVVMKRHASSADVVKLRTPRIRVESDEPVPYELDGDPGGETPMDIEILPDHWNVVVPEAWAIKKGFEVPADSQTSG